MSTVAIDSRDARLEPLRGWGRYARELLGGLRAVGFPVLELSGSWPGPEFLWEQAALPRLLRRAGADLVHSPNCFLPLRRPCPGVVTVHDLAFEVFPEDFAARTAWKYRTFAPRALRSAERVICVSAFTAQDAIARYGIDESKVRVVPNAPALAVGDAPATSGDGPYLLGIGDLRAKKAWDVLVRAWLDLRAEGMEHRLVIAGVEAGAGAGVRALAGDAPLSLPGYVGDTELDALLRGAAAFVLPSRYEGFGLVVLEAMTRGTPVLCADATALPETAGGAARLFGDGELPAALHEVLADPAPWVAAGRKRAAEFSWERTARETAAVYEELL